MVTQIFSWVIAVVLIIAVLFAAKGAMDCVENNLTPPPKKMEKPLQKPEKSPTPVKEKVDT